MVLDSTLMEDRLLKARETWNSIGTGKSRSQRFWRLSWLARSHTFRSFASISQFRDPGSKSECSTVEVGPCKVSAEFAKQRVNSLAHTILDPSVSIDSTNPSDSKISRDRLLRPSACPGEEKVSLQDRRAFHRDFHCQRVAFTGAFEKPLTVVELRASLVDDATSQATFREP